MSMSIGWIIACAVLVLFGAFCIWMIIEHKEGGPGGKGIK